MSAKLDAFTTNLFGLVASVWSQLCVSASVGLAHDVEPGTSAVQTPAEDDCLTLRTIRSMDNYAGYLTSNGLGSLDIGGRATRSGE
jgi:hypothetical protein